MKRITLTAHDGKQIAVTEYAPSGYPKGILQIVHGMVEHAGRYDFIGNYLASQGYLVIMDDHRGHGFTDPDTLGFCEGDMWEDTIKDLAALSNYCHEAYPDLNLVIMGHSYGSFLTQRYIELYPENVSGTILGGTARMDGLQVTAGQVVANIGWKFKGKDKPAKLIKKLTFDSYEKKLGGSFISSIPREAERYANDSKCSFVCSYNFYKYFFKGLKSIYKKQSLACLDKDKPILIMSGDTDPVGDYGKSVKRLYETYKKAGVKDVTLRLFEGVRHEFLNDVSREEASLLILGFLNHLC